MQEFNFPYDLNISSFLIFLILLFILATAVCWLGGYFYRARDPYGREDLMVGLKRANLWAKIASVLGFILIISTCLKWEDCFYRLNISTDYVQVWFDYPEARVITISKSDMDSIHYGFTKAYMNCHVQIQLKNGKSYESTDGNQCSEAYQALIKFVQSK